MYQIEFTCETSFHMRTQHECDMRRQKQHLTQLAVPHTSVVFLLSFIVFSWSSLLTNDENAHLLSTLFYSLGMFMYVLLTFYICFYVFHYSFYIFMSQKNVIYGGCIAFKIMGELYHILQGCITFAGYLKSKGTP